MLNIFHWIGTQSTVIDRPDQPEKRQQSGKMQANFQPYHLFCCQAHLEILPQIQATIQRCHLVGEQLIKENTAAMYATLNVNSEEKLHECVAMLRSARRIILTGIGASGLVAQNFAWKLMKIGFNAAAVRDMHALLATVQASSPDDLLLASSYTGVRRELNLAADEMLRVGGKVLAITGFTPNALQQRASHCLYTIAEEQATNSASISACHAQGMLTDLLFIALIQQDLELAPERIRHSEALVKKLV